jgi:hypothetical protein
MSKNKVPVHILHHNVLFNLGSFLQGTLHTCRLEGYQSVLESR